MNEIQAKDLCKRLIRAESESEVVGVLEQFGLWKKADAWTAYGGNENNFSTIGNQQSSPDTALVEKLINSVDAVLMREALRAGVDPEGDSAPSSIHEALDQFFGVKRGRLASIDATQRAKLAENILLIATGDKKYPSYGIVDRGEGQSPSKIPDTFLSLNKSNKLKIPFVQGKFNMGSTGALQFCSPRHNLQLLVSRRDPSVSDNADPTAQHWGFTVVRREDPSGNARSSSFRYLAPGGEIMKFQSAGIPVLPGAYPNPYEQELSHGTYLKLYEYNIGPSLRTNVSFDLYFRLSLLMPSLALPIGLYERRKGFRAHSHRTIMSGLAVRLDEDKRENVEDDFPNSAEITVAGHKMDLQIYAFKKGQKEKYAKQEGVIFTVNGQTHGFFPKSFFERKSVGMQALSDSILVVADCSSFEGRIREDLFMNSRDRLREGTLKDDIASQLASIIRGHPGLRELRERRKREEIENKLQDSKPLTDILEDLIRKSPTLSKLFVEGVTIKNPFNLTGANTKADFSGKRYPTYFKLSKGYPEEKPKECPRNRDFRVQFETDVENLYFKRDIDPGDFALFCSGLKLDDFSLNLWNGVATLNVKLPAEVKIGDRLHFETFVSDSTRVEPIPNEFWVAVLPEEKKEEGKNGKRKQSSDDDDGDQKKPSSLSIPEVVEVRKGDPEYRDDKQALHVKDYGEEGYRFYVNMDNVYLLTELKGSSQESPGVLESRFKFGLVLVGIAILEQDSKKNDESDDQAESIYDRVASVSEALAPMLLPMISTLGDISVDS